MRRIKLSWLFVALIALVWGSLFTVNAQHGEDGSKTGVEVLNDLFGTGPVGQPDAYVDQINQAAIDRMEQDKQQPKGPMLPVITFPFFDSDISVHKDKRRGSETRKWKVKTGMNDDGKYMELYLNPKEKTENGLPNTGIIYSYVVDPNTGEKWLQEKSEVLAFLKLKDRKIEQIKMLSRKKFAFVGHGSYTRYKKDGKKQCDLTVSQGRAWGEAYFYCQDGKTIWTKMSGIYEEGRKTENLSAEQIKVAEGR